MSYRCGGVSDSLREQLKAHYNASQQAAIASVMCPGQALFTLLQVGKFLRLNLQHFVHVYVCPTAYIRVFCTFMS